MNDTNRPVREGIAPANRAPSYGRMILISYAHLAYRHNVINAVTALVRGRPLGVRSMGT